MPRVSVKKKRFLGVAKITVKKRVLDAPRVTVKNGVLCVPRVPEQKGVHGEPRVTERIGTVCVPIVKLGTQYFTSFLEKCPHAAEGTDIGVCLSVK